MQAALKAVWGAGVVMTTVTVTGMEIATLAPTTMVERALLIFTEVVLVHKVVSNRLSKPPLEWIINYCSWLLLVRGTGQTRMTLLSRLQTQTKLTGFGSQSILNNGVRLNTRSQQLDLLRSPYGQMSIIALMSMISSLKSAPAQVLSKRKLFLAMQAALKAVWGAGAVMTTVTVTGMEIATLAPTTMVERALLIFTEVVLVHKVVSN